MNRLGKGVGDALAQGQGAAVVRIPNGPVESIAQVFRFGRGAFYLGLQGKGGHLAPVEGQIAIVLHQRLLQFLYARLIHPPRADLVPQGDGGRRAHRLADGAAGGHDPGGAHGRVGDRDIPPREHQVFHVAGIQAAIGNAIGRGRGVIDGGLFLG